MNEKGLVSVIIPLFNRETYIVKTIESVINQTHSNWECIIVDDHSTDDSFKIAKKFEKIDTRFKVKKRPVKKPKGANVCRNYGLSLARGEFIQWLDSDDLLHPRKFSTQVLELNQYPDLSFTVCKTACFIGSKNNVIRLWNANLISDNPGYDFLKRTIGFCINAPLWRRNCIIGKSPFDEKIKCWQDIEFHAKHILNGKKYSNLESIYVYCRLDSNERIGKKSLYRDLDKFVVFKNLINLQAKQTLSVDVMNLLQEFICTINKRAANNFKFILFFESLKFLSLNLIPLSLRIKLFINCIIFAKSLSRWCVRSLKKFSITWVTSKSLKAQ